MTTTLIILAHPEPQSFNGAWADASAQAAKANGDRVLVSDLGSLGFNAVEDRAYYPKWPADQPFDPLKAQEASASQPPDDIASEITKVEQADRIIFHFPIWWFAPPAILKGWMDRVLMHGRLHSVEDRFDTGLCKDKTALFCVTTGATADECAQNGKEGDILMQLWPAAQTLRYLGMTVLQPRILHSVHGYFEGPDKVDLDRRLSEALNEQHRLLERFETLPVWPFNTDNDFDDNGRLKPNAPSYSPFIRHDL